MYPTSQGSIPASLIAKVMQSAAPLPSSSGAVIWFASQLAPYPAISPRIFAPLLTACSYSSMIRIPLPSPITNPLLSLSKGIDARAGSSESERAFIEAKPPIPSSQIQLSAPPQAITSEYPSLI